MFSINELTGEVYVTEPIDRDVVTEVTFGVIVRDVSADPPQDGRGTLVITLLDVNDFPPMFPPPWSPESPVIRLSVPEELPINSVVASMEATDADSNIGGYKLTVQGDAAQPASDALGNTTAEPLPGEGPVLSINSATGVVTVTGRLDYESQTEVVCLVEVWDTGLPQLTATATLIVEVR